MASATVDHHQNHNHNHLHPESLPLIDLNLLSQSELLSLSLCSSSAPPSSLSDDVVLTPKIDRSVFNESAGSRKQTFSRLRLAPRNQSQFPPPNSRISRHYDEPLDPENSQIISHLKSLFSIQSTNKNNDDEDDDDDDHLVPVHIEYKDYLPLPSSSALQLHDVGKKRKRGRPRKDENRNVVEEKEMVLVYKPIKDENRNVVEDKEKEMVLVNKNGMMVDLVALGSVEDPFVDEFRRRTVGMENEEKLLAFLTGLNGEWGSRRKKRKVVDASDFGDALPLGWKLMLCVRKNAGRVWLACRRYISPNGQQFVSCKDVSSYLLSFSGFQEASQPSSDHIYDSIQLDNKSTSGPAADVSHRDDNNGADLVFCSPLPVTSISTEHVKQVLSKLGSPGKVQRGNILKCHKCPMTFDVPDDFLHHLLYSHRRPTKKFRRNTSITEGVIMKDGKYECQLCRKLFEERRRYNGHLGVHIKMYVKKVEDSGVTIMQKSNGPVADGVLPEVLKMQESIRIDKDSVEKTSNAKANDEISSGFPCNEIKANAVVSTYTDKYSDEQNLLSLDKQAMEADRNDKTLVVEDSVKQDGVSNINNDKVEKVNAGTGNIAAKLNVCLDAEIALSNYENNSLCKSSDEIDVLKCTTNGINNFGRQGSPQNCFFALSASDQACAIDNNVNGVSTRSMEEHKQEIGSESGVLASNDKGKTFRYDNVKTTSISSTMQEMEVDNGNKVAADVPVSGFCDSHHGLDVVLTNANEQSSEGCSLVPSRNEQRSGSINNMITVQERGSESGLTSSVDKQTCVVNNNLRSVSTSTLDEPKSDEIDKYGNNELTIDFGSSFVIKKPCQEKDYDGGLLTLFGSEQSFGLDNNVNKISAGTMEVPKVDEVRNSSELLDAVGSYDTGTDTGFVTSIEQGRSINCCLLVSSSNKQSFQLENDGVCNSTLEELKQGKDSESRLIGPSGNGKTFDVEDNVNKVSSITMEEPKHKVESSWIRNRHSRLDADVVTGKVQESCSEISGNDQTFVSKNNIPGACGSTVDESKQKRGSVEGSFCLSDKEQACRVENNLNGVYTGSCQEVPKLDHPENSRPRELIIDFGNYARPGEDVMSEIMWKSDEENVLLSGLADSSSQLLQSSGGFPTFDMMLDKGESELFGIGEKYDSTGFEGLRSDSIEHMEYNFLTAQTNSHSEDSKVLQYDAEVAQGFESFTWLEKEALPLLPKIASRHQVPTMCVWCRNEFHHESFDTGAQTGSIGFMCATCKAKFAGPHNFL